MALYKQPGSSCWHYDFTVDGKRYRGSTKESRKTAALAIETDLRAKAKEQGPNFTPMRRAMTLRELSSRFLQWKEEAQLELKTRRYYEYGWKLLAATPLASLHLAAVDGDAVDAIRFVGMRGEEVSGQYANQAIRTLKVMLNKAREWKLLSDVPLIRLRKAAGRSGVITPEDEAALLRFSSQPLTDVLVIAMDTGMRPSEIFAMRWEDVFFGQGEVFIPRSKTEAGRRRVPMSERMRELLMVRRKAAKSEWVFPARRGSGHLNSVAVGFRNAKRRARDAGHAIDDRLVLYSARHTFGTYALAQTKNLPVVMQAMGHASIRSALPYQHHSMDGIRSVIESRNARKEEKAAS